MRVALAQINPTVGDILGNYKKIISYIDRTKNKADLIVFPELSLSGYPPEDLVLKHSFLLDIKQYMDYIREYSSTTKTAIILGAPVREGKSIYNAGIFFFNGKRTLVYKNKLPNYGVFDEKRIFKKGKKYKVIKHKANKIGLLICEDMWFDSLPKHLSKQGANIFISINASPYESDKLKQRKNICKKIALRNRVPLVYLNQIGGQDELVFDGNSFFMNSKGEVIKQCSPWKEDLNIIDTKKDKYKETYNFKSETESPEFNTWSALTLGLRDYFLKNSFKKIVLGLSGGIDSAVSAAIAADAAGSKNVMGIMMPSKYSSKGSIDDAEMTAKLLKIKTTVFNILDIHEVYTSNIQKHFSNNIKSLTDENLQSRIRGSILMAYSNNFSHLLISTGNKSEMSVGYSTIYGDMNGGFNVLKDVYKTDLYRLAKWRNKLNAKIFKGPVGKVIPDNSIIKSPSAELKPNQKDTDNLPTYPILDKILFYLIEEELSTLEIIKKGYNENTVTKVSDLLFKSEYKRRQAPPGVKLGSKAFGKERRYPITNKFKN